MTIALRSIGLLLAVGGLGCAFEEEVAPSTGALGTPLLPDIVEEISHLGIHNQQQREVLRFSTTHWNQGAGNLQIRGHGEVGPCPPELADEGSLCTFAVQEILDSTGAVVETHPAGVSVFHTEHNHWHQADVALFQLRHGSLDGPVVGETAKVTFCLIDYDSDPLFVDRRSTRNYFDCDGLFQGISVGWGDEYHHSTPGQDLDITGLPAGIYYLTHLANPDGNWAESNMTNNDAWLELQLTRRGANPEIRVLDESPCPVTDPSDPDYQVLCGNTSNK